MAKSAQEPILVDMSCIWGVHVGYAMLHVKHCLVAIAIVVGVQVHTHHAKQQQAARRHTRTKYLLLLGIFERFSGEGLSGLVVFSRAIYGRLVVTPVFWKRLWN